MFGWRTPATPAPGKHLSASDAENSISVFKEWCRLRQVWLDRQTRQALMTPSITRQDLQNVSIIRGGRWFLPNKKINGD